MHHRIIRGLTLLTLAIAMLATGAAADSNPPQRRVTIDDIRAEDEARTTRWTGTYRARLTHPQTFSAGVGVLRSRLPESWECTSTCPFEGWLTQLEPGLHGIQLSSGYATLLAEKRHNRHFMADAWLGWAIKGVVLRTWGDANLSPSDQTFAGAEFAFSVTRVNFSLGTLRRVGGDGEKDWILSGGMGWGF